MEADEIMGMMALLALVVIPALALTARFAMKPIVESILQLKKGLADNQDGPKVEAAQLALLEREVMDLRREVEELKTLREFDHALRPAGAQQLQLPKDDR